jgi:hypothetical protein
MKIEILVKEDGTWLSVEDIEGGGSYCFRLETFAWKSQSGLLSIMCKEIRHAASQPNAQASGGYSSIHDCTKTSSRELWITDRDGNTVCLHDEEIGELYRGIKPPLAG